jgi:hypothetical protein
LIVEFAIVVILSTQHGSNDYNSDLSCQWLFRASDY